MIDWVFGPWTVSQVSQTWRSGAFAILCALALSACGDSPDAPEVACEEPGGAVQIPAGSYRVGSDTAYREEGPAREVTVDEFWIDRGEVTVARFKAFVEATGYVTVAERPVDPAVLPDVPMTAEQRELFLSPGAAVFDPSEATSPRQLRWWVYVPGANWRYPEGPGKPPADARHPVTQIALEDALAFAQWAGGRLATEAEWEVAASLGAPGASARRTAPDNANTWQGVFPALNEEADGFAGVAPAGCFEADAIGLYDMLGNVWEWTSDPYAPQREDPGDIAAITAANLDTAPPEGTIKGGSYLCAPNYCMRYRPSARQAQETGLGTNHIGFRLAYDEEPPG